MTLAKPNITAFVAAAPGLIVLFAFFLVPLGNMALRSITDPVFGFFHYQVLVESPTYLRVGGRTIWISLVGMVGCVFVGTPIAYSIAHSETRFLVRITIAVLILSFLSSSLVRTFAWMILFGAQGPVVGLLNMSGFETTTLLATPLAVIVGMIHFLLPIYVLTAYAGFRNVPYEFVIAAEGLGASRLYALRTIYLPLALPAIANASSLVFVIGVGFFITPALLGGPRQTMLAQLIARSVTQFGDFGFAAAAGLVLLLITVLVLFLIQRVFK